MDRLVAELRSHHRFLLSTHRAPDGDGIGSMLALAGVLRTLGKEVVLYNPDPVPVRYRFLPGIDSIQQGLSAEQRFDATVVVDVGDKKLLGPQWPGREVTGPVIVLDHHRGHVPFGDLEVRTDACAVGEMVYELAMSLDVPIDRDMAVCIYAAMTTDTGGFRYASTSPRAMRIAAPSLGGWGRPVGDLLASVRGLAGGAGSPAWRCLAHSGGPRPRTGGDVAGSPIPVGEG